MQELEKILEEINRRIDEYVDHDYVRGSGDVVKGLSIAKSIVRKHMNDGWIHVEERLPEEGQEVWISTKYGTERATYTEHLVNQRVRVFLKIGGTMSVEEVSAWQPYHVPDPYTP